MKSLHHPNLYNWSSFDEERNIDFNSIAWIRPEGNVLIDPLPLSDHDWKHLQTLGGAAWIVVTNSDHIRDSAAIAQQTGAQIAGPRGEKETFPLRCDRWLDEGEDLVSGLMAIVLQGSKTPGELALLLEGKTLITGDLVRAHRPGALMLLPPSKLQDQAAALASVRRLAELPVEAVLVGDGWSVFQQGQAHLQQLAPLG
jgi:Metallo-beta-lactamase superfamily